MTTATLEPPVATGMRPGIHPGVSFVDYFAIDAINNSKLTLFSQKTPAHARWEITHPDEDTDSLRVGSATHAAILEPDRFAREYVKPPEVNRRTNAGKQEWADWLLSHPKQNYLLPAEWDMACALRDAVWSHKLAPDLLKGAGQNEMTAIWNDVPTGLLCKGRVDRFTQWQGWSVVVDVKTAKDASPKEFAKACVDYMYHQAAAFYLDGLATIAPHDRRFIHLVIEKAPPYCVAVYELDEPAIREGRAQYMKALATYSECLKRNEWPGYAVGVEALDIPSWAYQLTAPEK